MTDDLFADDDLFAVRPAPTRVKSRSKPAEVAPKLATAPVWIDNTGERPKLKAGKRVAVILHSGETCGEVPINNDSKLGWDPETTRWSLSPEGHACQPFDVKRYRVL